MGPLGNGFGLNISNKKIALVSGGIGIAPLLYLKDNLKNCLIDFYAGFKENPFSVDNVEKTVNKLYISLEKRIDMDKLVSYQHTKNVKVVDNSYITDIFSAEKYEIVYCCGPKIMMEKVVKMCIEKSIPIYVLMENKMACG